MSTETLANVDLTAVRQWAVLVLLSIGVLFEFLGAVGVVRMPDVFSRLEAASKTSTLGSAGVFLAVALHFGDLGIASRALAVIVFAFLTVPIGAHVISRAAYRAGLPMWNAKVDELRDRKESGA